MKTIIILSVLLCSGCAALKPTSIPIEVEHVSHITQHFGPHPTNYGYDDVSVGLKWKRGNVSVQVSEGYVKNLLDGIHEVTTAKLTYEIPLQ